MWIKEIIVDEGDSVDEGGVEGECE